MDEIDRRAYVGGFPLPRGRLTSRLIDLSPGIGLAYERSVKYEKDLHSHDRINLTFPVGAARLFFESHSPKRRWVADGKTFLWMPADVPHRQGALSLVWENLALFPDPRALSSALRRQAGATARQRAVLDGTGVYRRSELLDELVQRLFHERVVLRKRASRALATAVLDEALRIACGVPQPERAPKLPEQPAVDLAIRFMEANLFSPVSAGEIAAAARTSVSTLYRVFRSELGMAPQEYQRLRRLDESVELLKTGDYRVSDVAILVGYEELAAFSKAFKNRFGHPPTAVTRTGSRAP